MNTAPNEPVYTLRAAQAQLDELVKHAAADDVLRVWQGPTGSNFATLSAAELRDLRAGKPSTRTRTILSDAPNGHVTVQFWYGGSRGASASMTVGALRTLLPKEAV